MYLSTHCRDARVNEISRKWEKWFHTCATSFAYNLCNDPWIFVIFGTQVKKTATFCSSNGYCRILSTFWAIWPQNFDNFILGHTVKRCYIVQENLHHLQVQLKTWVQEVCKSIFGEIELNTLLGSPTCNKYQNASYFQIWGLKMCFSGGS